MLPASRDLMRAINQFNVLNTIRTAGSISRTKLSEITGQSRASVTNITARLIAENLIYEKETRDSAHRGRRRVLLALNADAAYVVGIKLSAFRVSFAVTDMQADIRSSIVMPVRTSERSAGFVADLIEEGIRHCVNDARLKMDQIAGIGIGVPGFVDRNNGFCHWTPLYRQGKRPLRDLVEKRLGIPTTLENDANAVTMAHQWFGDGMGVQNFVVITIEDGVGMGAVVNGQLYRGAKGVGAEFGHVVVVPGGNPCRCGKRGCLEAYVSDFSILAAARKIWADTRGEGPPRGELNLDDVMDAARRGHPELVRLFDRAGKLLGQGVAGLIQILNPSKIILSGQGVRAGDLMFAPMRAVVAAQCNPVLHDATEIIIHKWQDTDWARGAASLVLQALYKTPFEKIRPVI
ncbi:MAG: ROK family transcriptional regulator [Desulfobacterales bacterium]|nr:ROK family transcriptional regulator [Desulfobacterales bacterium]